MQAKKPNQTKKKKNTHPRQTKPQLNKQTSKNTNKNLEKEKDWSGNFAT